MPPLTTAAPFVLLEDAHAGAVRARMFAAPVETIVAWRVEDIAEALERVRAGLKCGQHAAGWMNYEAGLAFEPRLAERGQRNEAPRFPLLWFGLFDSITRLSPEDVAALLPPAEGAWLSAPTPRITRDEYTNAFTRAHDYIVSGDIYQVNLSYRADLAFAGHPLAAYARLRAAGQGGWSGAVFDGSRWLLSTSPELFFKMSSGRIEARPMKGTAKRRADPIEDRAAADALRDDPKERAENLMIVDLLRNDLSRIAKRGTVRTPALFTVETYPTLHTLTSTVRADLREDHDAIDMLRTLFPCGSITGAPKIRAMEIIRELEADLRGPYTGSIGWISPDGDAEFNVAIRTVAIADGKAELGVGSAIVYDSVAAAEWEECLTKSAFVTRGAPDFELIETMRVEPSVGVSNLDLHLARLEASASALEFKFDLARIVARIEAALLQAREPCVLRLTLAQDGTLTLSTRPLPRVNDPVVPIASVSRPVAAHDFRLRHKTTLRDFYDDTRAMSGVEEIVFVDADGFVTEGSFSNIFVERNGVLLTPPLSRGLLPGVLRARLLRDGRAIEADLRLADLAEGCFIGNAVRGLIPAVLAQAVNAAA